MKKKSRMEENKEWNYEIGCAGSLGTGYRPWYDEKASAVVAFVVAVAAAKYWRRQRTGLGRQAGFMSPVVEDQQKDQDSQSRL